MSKQMSLRRFVAQRKRPAEEETEEEPTTSKKKKFNSQYQESYLKYGFIGTGDSRDPVLNKPGESSLSVQEEDQLLEITNVGGLQSMFERTTLPLFWMKIKAENPNVAIKALKTLLPFPTSYLCEARFSTKITE